MPLLGKIHVGTAIFHSSACMAEVSTNVLQGIIDPASKEYEETVTTLANWSKYTLQGLGSYGAQKTFHVIYKYVLIC